MNRLPSKFPGRFVARTDRQACRGLGSKLLISLSREGDESLRCQAAQSVGAIGGEIEATLAALIDLLQDPSSSVKATAAHHWCSQECGFTCRSLSHSSSARQRRLGADRRVRSHSKVGPLDHAATEVLVEGLTSPRTNVVPHRLLRRWERLALLPKKLRLR